jgi:hypothetical protein
MAYAGGKKAVDSIGCKNSGSHNQLFSARPNSAVAIPVRKISTAKTDRAPKRWVAHPATNGENMAAIREADRIKLVKV